MLRSVIDRYIRCGCIARRCLAMLLAAAFMICSAAPGTWAAEESDERKAFFSVNEEILDAFGRQIEEEYGDADRLLLNYVFKSDATRLIYEAQDEKIRTESYFHDFTLNPAQRETIIAINTYFCKSEPDIELRISFDSEYEEQGHTLALTAADGEISLDQLKRAVVANDGELIYIIDLDEEKLEACSYYIDEVGRNYILRFAQTDMSINSVMVSVNDGCYAAVRGMETELEYTEPAAAFYDEPEDAWLAEYECDDNAAVVKLAGTSDTEIIYCNDDYDLEITDGIDAETAAVWAADFKRACEMAEGDADGEDAAIDITEGASMLYLDSYLFIDPEEIREYRQSAAPVYYDAQINIYGSAKYISGMPDTLGAAEEYLGNVFESAMADGTVGIKVAKIDDDTIAGELVLELPEDAGIRFAKGDGSGLEFEADDVADGIIAGTSETKPAETSAAEATTASAETSAAEATTASAETSAAEATTASAETSAAVETTASEETTAAAETTASGETSAASETSAAGESTAAAETSADEETSAAETTASDEPVSVGIVMSQRFLRKASYCAVAEDMTVCAVYDERGRLSKLADGYTEDDIAAYILLMSADEDTRIERIDIIYSDIVAGEEGQEYASLILADDAKADMIVNRIIEAEADITNDLTIDGITEPKADVITKPADKTTDGTDKKDSDKTSDTSSKTDSRPQLASPSNRKSEG